MLSHSSYLFFLPSLRSNQWILDWSMYIFIRVLGLPVSDSGQSRREAVGSVYGNETSTKMSAFVSRGVLRKDLRVLSIEQVKKGRLILPNLRDLLFNNALRNNDHWIYHFIRLRTSPGGLLLRSTVVLQKYFWHIKWRYQNLFTVEQGLPVTLSNFSIVRIRCFSTSAVTYTLRYSLLLS